MAQDKKSSRSQLLADRKPRIKLCQYCGRELIYTEWVCDHCDTCQDIENVR